MTWDRRRREQQKGAAVMAIAAAFVAGAVAWVGAMVANIDRTDASRYDQTRHDMRTLRVAIEARAMMGAGANDLAKLQTALTVPGPPIVEPQPATWEPLTEDHAPLLGLPARMVQDAWGNPIHLYMVAVDAGPPQRPPDADGCWFYLVAQGTGAAPTGVPSAIAPPPPAIRFCGSLGTYAPP